MAGPRLKFDLTRAHHPDVTDPPGFFQDATAGAPLLACRCASEALTRRQPAAVPLPVEPAVGVVGVHLPRFRSAHTRGLPCWSTQCGISAPMARSSQTKMLQ